MDIVNLREFEIRAKLKIKLYRRIIVEVHLFLPAYRHCQIDLMALIATKEKKVAIFVIISELIINIGTGGTSSRREN